MAEQQSASEKIKILDSVIEKINNKAGKKIIGRLGADPEIMDKVTIKFIPSTCLDINRVTGGGYPRGRCTLIAGGENVGKTSRVLEDIAYNMSQDPDFIALWVESEKSMDKNYIVDTFGVDAQRFIFLEYDSEMGAEGILNHLYAMMKTVGIDLVCINSLKCLTPKQEIESDFDDKTPGIAARLNGKITRKFTSLVADGGTAFILITHTHTDFGTYGSPQAISGGRAIRYWATLSLMFSSNSLQASDLITKEQGLKISVTVKKNRCRPDKFPFEKFFYYAIFGKGTDQVASAIPVLTNLGIIKQNGPLYSVLNRDGTELKRFTGKKNLYEGLQQDQELWSYAVSCLEGEAMSEEEIEEAKREEQEDAAVVQATEEALKPKKKGKK